MAEVIVGIDLGTTNSLVAICDEKGPRVLEGGGDGGGAIVPSVVRFELDGSVVIGEVAKAEAVQFPLSTVSSVKRLMGRSIHDAEADLAYLSYQVVEGEHNTARVAVPSEDGVRAVSPQEVSAHILRELKQRAERAFGHPVHKAVVTTPAYFDDAQRQATRDAGRLAGLDVVRIVNEPTAAALAYGLGANESESRTIAVYDLGGGTFDISILRLTPKSTDDGLPAFFQVLSTAGDTHLGGDDVDFALVDLFTREIAEATGAKIAGDDLGALPPQTRRALLSFAQGVKHRLSEVDRAAVQIQVNEEYTYDRDVTRDELDAIMKPWIDRTINACARALHDAKRELDASSGNRGIDAVIMVGGSTRIPLVRERVAAFFGVEPYTALDPDMVVALGASVQAGIMSGIAKDALLLDVIPLSLGIETVGGAVAKVIAANTTVPARATEMFSTSVDGQVSIKLHILQGEREMVADCRSLGEFHLAGLPPMPAGIPQLEVEFLVDASGVLNVSATERRSGKRSALQVVPNHGLTRDEVAQIEKDSFTHAIDDMNQHRVVDLVTNSKLDLKWIGEKLDRHGDALEGAYRAELDGMVVRLVEFVKKAEADWRSVDADSFYGAKNELDHASVRLQEIAITETLKNEQ